MKFRFRLNVNKDDSTRGTDAKELRRADKKKVGKNRPIIHQGMNQPTVDLRNRLHQGNAQQIPFRNNGERNTRYTGPRKMEAGQRTRTLDLRKTPGVTKSNMQPIPFRRQQTSEVRNAPYSETREPDLRKTSGVAKSNMQPVPFRRHRTNQDRNDPYSETREPESTFRKASPHHDRREPDSPRRDSREHFPFEHEQYRAVPFTKARSAFEPSEFDVGYGRKQKLLDKKSIQKKLTRNIDAKLDAFRSQLGAEFGQEDAAPYEQHHSNQWQSRRSQPLDKSSSNTWRQSSAPEEKKWSPATPMTRGAPKPLHTSQKSAQKCERIKALRELACAKYPAEAFNAINFEALEKIPEMFGMVCNEKCAGAQLSEKTKKASPTNNKEREHPVPLASCGNVNADWGQMDEIMENILGNNAKSMRSLRTAAISCSQRDNADGESIWTREESWYTRGVDDETLGTKSSADVKEKDSDESGSNFDGDSTCADEKSYWTEKTGNDTHYHGQANMMCGVKGFDGAESVWTGKTDNESYQTYPRSERQSSYTSRDVDDGESRWTAEQTTDNSYKRFDGAESLWTGVTDGQTKYQSEFDGESQWTEDRTARDSYDAEESRWTDERLLAMSASRAKCRGRYDGESVWTEDRTEAHSDRESRYSREYDEESRWTRRTDGDTTYHSRYDDSTHCDDETRITKDFRRRRNDSWDAMRESWSDGESYRS